jgi:uncharacterized protein
MEKLRERFGNSRFLSWVLNRQEMWLWTRHNVALGAAIGVSMGLLIPVAQIAASALLSLLLRAHVGVASMATLITNPVTFGPVYYAAYKFGEYITGVPFSPLSEQSSFWVWIGSVGLPLAVGLSVFSLIGFCLTYCMVWAGFEIRGRFRLRKG